MRKVIPKPKPERKPARKHCPAGHWLPPRHRAGQACGRCEEEARRVAPEAERKRWAEELGPPPAELVIRDHSGRVVVRAVGLARRPGRR